MKINDCFTALGSVPNDDVKETLVLLTLKAPITTAAADIHKYIFSLFQRK